MRHPCPTVCWMLQHATPFLYCGQRARKASAIIPRTVVLSPPALVIDGSTRPPELARRMLNHRPRSSIGLRIPLLVPQITAGNGGVYALGIAEEDGNTHCGPRRRARASISGLR